MISCKNCNTPLPAYVFNMNGPTVCPSCSVPIQAHVYPAYFNPLPLGSKGQALIADGQAGCYYHPKKQAIVPCSSCGRFLCALCDVEFNDQHLCPVCLERGKRKRKIVNLENHRTLYDTIALGFSVLPLLLFWPLTILTAPVSFFLAIRFWNAPSSIVPRTKIRLILAILLSIVQMGIWAMIILSIIAG